VARTMTIAQLVDLLNGAQRKMFTSRSKKNEQRATRCLVSKRHKTRVLEMEAWLLHSDASPRDVPHAPSRHKQNKTRQLEKEAEFCTFKSNTHGVPHALPGHKRQTRNSASLAPEIPKLDPGLMASITWIASLQL